MASVNAASGPHWARPCSVSASGAWPLTVAQWRSLVATGCVEAAQAAPVRALPHAAHALTHTSRLPAEAKPVTDFFVAEDVKLEAVLAPVTSRCATEQCAHECAPLTPAGLGPCAHLPHLHAGRARALLRSDVYTKYVAQYHESPAVKEVSASRARRLRTNWTRRARVLSFTSGGAISGKQMMISQTAFLLRTRPHGCGASLG